MTLVKVNRPLGRTFEGFMNDFFNDFPVAVSKTFREDVMSFPPINITEKENAYQIELAAPGYDKADFKINMEGNVLNISSEKKDEQKEETDKSIRREFSYKSFKRSFTLDEKIDMEKIDARYENGVLKVELPKKQATQAPSKEINIQ
ncbi:MAG TPA: Hsp20/alpha crystallin family protein [Ferruginibacter sp.]|nr:Hsp20/alpha crystallin family protein [Ferruginibacter sp.]HRN78845.1 Hsp20/alpha crystallin family protein [Ferruginibacter sp.]HRO17957.1 Hsp20/alpha crystallin family protein [Ferruginibacter sp.]HRQ19797.1 Hsp20/alpha crystallin family protein [Ferruginibacter sp.]